jgi:hypothetical protein
MILDSRPMSRNLTKCQIPILKIKILSELEKVVGTCKYSLSRANEHQDLIEMKRISKTH